MIQTWVAYVKVHRTNHCSIATDSKDAETMVVLNAKSDEMTVTVTVTNILNGSFLNFLKDTHVCNRKIKHPK